jgi:plasmid stabilization system protein ParE
MKLEFHPEAEWELIEAAEYYERQVPGLGERLEAEVRRATDLLLDHPEIGAPADPVLRKLVLNRFPYTLYYSVTSSVVRIEVVAHQSRRPGYWRSRSGR